MVKSSESVVAGGLDDHPIFGLEAVHLVFEDVLDGEIAVNERRRSGPSC